jgi:hypothetical protein
VMHGSSGFMSCYFFESTGGEGGTCDMLITSFGRRGKGVETWLWIREAFWEKQRKGWDMGHNESDFWKLRGRRHDFVPQCLFEGKKQGGGPSAARALYFSKSCGEGHVGVAPVLEIRERERQGGWS